MIDNNNVIEHMIEVTFPVDNFLKLKETLERIGISNTKNELYQSCHILQKKGKFYIVHFKELFLLDGKTSSLNEEDIGRRNKIISLLKEWKLLDVVDESKIVDQIPINKLKIIPFAEKENWKLIPKYKIGKKK